MTKSDARQVKPKPHRLNINLVTVYHPFIKNLQTVTSEITFLYYIVILK